MGGPWIQPAHPSHRPTTPTTAIEANHVWLAEYTTMFVLRIMGLGELDSQVPSTLER
jgi:hypothetical protein